jgi:hypothetical protein
MRNDVDRDFLQRRSSLLVFKGHGIEPHCALEPRGRPGVRQVADVRLDLEELDDPLAGGGRLSQPADVLGGFAHGPEGSAQIGQEHDELACG